MANSRNTNSCSHALGIFSDMVVLALTPDYTLRKCQVCGEEETLKRAGKLWGGYSIEAESFRDTERRKYAKDLLQPKDKHGSIDELYQHAWGTPYKKAEVGRDMDKYQIKEN